MLQAPTSSSSQNTIIYKLSGNIGDIITLKNNEGIEIISFETEKKYSAITISEPTLEINKTYNLYINNIQKDSTKLVQTITQNITN